MRGTGFRPNPGTHFNFPKPNPGVLPAQEIIEVPVKIPRVKVTDGGITDKNQVELLQLGNQVQVAPPPSNAVTLGLATVWVNGDDPSAIDPRITNKGTILQARSNLPDHPKDLVVNINPPIVPASNQGFGIWYDLKVRASWGVGADRCSAIIDVLNGAQFSIAATELVIEGFYTIVTVPAGTPQNALMGASIGEYTRASSSFGPSFTSIILVSGATLSQNVQVPPYAKAVTIYPATVAGVSVAVTVGFVTSSNAITSFVTVAQASNGCPCTYPLPNDVVFVKITFPNATDVALVRFDLAL